MWQHVLLFVFVLAEASAEEISTYQPFLPAHRVDVQLLPDDQESLENEEMERTLDSDPENLLTEAVRLLQIDNVQTLEEKLRLTENSLKEKEEETKLLKQTCKQLKVELSHPGVTENALLAHFSTFGMAGALHLHVTYKEM